MAERLPDNLAMLHEAFSQEAIERIQDGHSFVLDGVEFVCRYLPESTPDRFYILKPEDLLDRYREMLPVIDPATIFELGIAEGGSTAWLALCTDATRIIAIDNEESRLDALDQFVADRGLESVVRTHYGVDQADAARLHEIVAADVPDDGIDLVLDDASHRYGPTRASFEALFPHVRAGGWYIIEDWGADQEFRRAIRRVLDDESAPGHAELKAGIAEAMADPARNTTPAKTPMIRLGLELALASGTSDPAVRELRMNRYFLAVQRGPADLDPDSFSLDGISVDYLDLLSKQADEAAVS